MRILFLGELEGYGGGPNWNRGILQVFKELDYKVHTYSTGSPVVWCSGRKEFQELVNDFNLLWKILEEEVENYVFDFVVTDSFKVAFVSTNYWKLPTLLLPHLFLTNEPSQDIVFPKIVSWNKLILIASSEVMLKALVEEGYKKQVLLPTYAGEVQGSKPFEERKNQVIFSGRLESRKGVKFLEKVKSKLPVVITNPSKPLPQKDYERLVATSKAIICLSTFENYYMVAHEAARFGTPTVFLESNHWFVEIWRSSGFPVLSEDNFVTYVNKILEDAEEWNKISRIALDYATKWSMDTVSDLVDKNLRTLIQDLMPDKTPDLPLPQEFCSKKQYTSKYLGLSKRYGAEHWYTWIFKRKYPDLITGGKDGDYFGKKPPSLF